ncbi:MAG TPA: sigma-70 family RNA polymerase sigma factor [Thermoanaerobaculia bacterium]|nr:sigma-70 family RNA polymerase sigma factor [Thermoanaerobaculia bacterium]
MPTRDNGETRLARVLRTLSLQPRHVVKESTAVARILGLGDGISRTHLTRLRTGTASATADMILLLVATIRKMTGVAVRATDVFDLEPAAAGAHGAGIRDSGGDGSVFSALRGIASRSLVVDQDRPSAAQTLEVLYREHASLLRVNARRRFRIPEDDIDALIHDVFASFLERQPRVNDMRAFLIGATNNACMHYWRKRRHETPLLPVHEERADHTTEEELERWALYLAVVQTLARLGPSCRETLRRYYLSEEKPQTIADRLETTKGYVFQLLSLCRKQARKIFQDLTEPKR